MTSKEREAIQQALEALQEYRDTQMIKAPRRAITALREALEHSGESRGRILTGFKITNVDDKLEFEPVYYEPANRPQNCGTGYCSCIECPYEAAAIRARVEK